MKTLIESSDKYKLWHHTGTTVFRGCQCFKDCTCNEDFKPQSYDYYTVVKLFNKIRTTMHSSIEEARERINFLNSL